MYELTVQLVLFLFPLAYSPGPGNMFFAANGARFGFGATVAANAGYHIATLIVTLAIGLGFGLVAAQLPNFLLAVKYAGSAYILYLAWLLFRAGTFEQDVDPRHAGFSDGIVLLVLNPKAYMIIALIFAQFTPATGAANLWTIVWIATVFTLNNLIAFSVWIVIGDALASAFRTEAHARKLNMFFGAMLAAVAVWMLFR